MKGCGKNFYVGWYWINCGEKADNKIKLCEDCLHKSKVAKRRLHAK